MKKLLITGIVCSMVLTTPICAAAQPACGIGECNVGECFIDEDNDGICDHFVDDDEDGICDHCHEHGKPARVVRSRRTSRGGHHSDRHSGHHGRHC